MIGCSWHGIYYSVYFTIYPWNTWFFLLLIILLLVVDYARAWQVIQARNRPLKAIGFGFSLTFRTFKSSYPLMIFIMAIQIIYGWLILNIIPGMNPVTGGGVLLLFLLSQILFIVKIFLKLWRYGSVTSMMELIPKQVI